MRIVLMIYYIVFLTTDTLLGNTLTASSVSVGTFYSSDVPYTNTVKWLRPVAYWPLSDSSGTTATDLMGLSSGVYSSVSFTNALFPKDGMRCAGFGSSSRINIFSDALTNSLNGSSGSVLCWVKITNSAALTDGAAHYIFNIGSSDYFSLSKSASQYLWEFYYTSGGVTKQRSHYRGTTDWLQWCWTWDKANDQVRLYVNGVEYQTALTGLGNWANNIPNNYCAIGARTSSGLTPFAGWLAHVALFNRPLSSNEVSSLYFNEFPNATGLLCVGDSKTENDAWPELLADSLTTQTSTKWVTRPIIAVGGDDVTELLSHITNDLTRQTLSVSKICVDVGANDIPEPTPKNQFTNDFCTVINNLKAKWPAADIYISKVWRRGYGTNVAYINGCIDEIVAMFPTHVFAGHNQAVWLENGDDGATYTQDGVHYSLTSTVQPLVASKWMTAFGY